MKSEQASPIRKTLPHYLLAIVTILLQSGCSLVGIRSADEPTYSVLQKEDQFEVREYDTLLTAETLVEANFDKAGNIAFKRLFAYISGENEAASKIAMTAPVMALDENRTSGEKISMTAPVTGQETALGWRYAFILPSDYTLATAPVPSNQLVRLKQVPARKVAIVQYSGSFSEVAYEENLILLQNWMRQNKLEADSLPRVAGYDPPWTLPSLRRNEIMVDLKN
jgi:hypothetical protein